MMVTLPLPPSIWRKDKKAREAWKLMTGPLIKRLRLPDGPVEIILDFYAPFLNSKGKPNARMPDTKNLVYPVEDWVAECLGYNDRRNFRLVATRHHSRQSRCTVQLRPWRLT